MHYHNKLIRDNIPAIIARDGVVSKVRVMDHEEYLTELGDVLEVIDAIITAFTLDPHEVERIKKERKDTRGGFGEKLFLEYTE